MAKKVENLPAVLEPEVINELPMNVKTDVSFSLNENDLIAASLLDQDELLEARLEKAIKARDKAETGKNEALAKLHEQVQKAAEKWAADFQTAWKKLGSAYALEKVQLSVNSSTPSTFNEKDKYMRSISLGATVVVVEYVPYDDNMLKTLRGYLQADEDLKQAKGDQLRVQKDQQERPTRERKLRGQFARFKLGNMPRGAETLAHLGSVVKERMKLASDANKNNGDE